MDWSDSGSSDSSSSGSGFHVIPDSLFRASLKFLDLQAASGRILSGLGQELLPTGGMAGNDDAGRSFAKRYDPAAQSVSTGLASANKQLGDSADGLLAMAFNYLQAEQGSNFLVPQAVGGGPQRSCRADEQAVALPSAVGNGQESSLPLIGQFWPQGDPDRMRQAARTWRQVAALAEELSRRGSMVVAEVTYANNGKAVDAFAESWAPMTTLLSQVAIASRSLAKANDAFAQRVDDQRHKMETIAGTMAIATGLGIAATVFSLGISDGAVVVVDTAEVAAAADAAITFGVAVEGAAEVTALVGADAAIEATILTLPTITAVAAETSLVSTSSLGIAASVAIVPAGVALYLTNVKTVAAAGDAPLLPLAGGVGDPLLNGAIPPMPGSPFSPLLPQQQAEAMVWVAGLRSVPTSTKTPWGQYQVRVAGPKQYEMPTGDGRLALPDGFRPLDGAIIDAKYMDDPSCSPYNLDNRGNSKVFQPMFENAFVHGNDEFNRYAAVIKEPSNHAQFLEVVVNNPKEVPYFQFLLAAQHAPGVVRVVP